MKIITAAWNNFRKYQIPQHDYCNTDVIIIKQKEKISERMKMKIYV